MKKLSLTIGIPAYNEEENIVTLLKSLLAQKEDGYSLRAIIVSSDGSTDETVKHIRILHNPFITLIDNRTRNGVAAVQNQIIRSTKTEILVLLNADIQITDSHFIAKLITPILQKKADLTSAHVVELPARNFLENVINISNVWKRRVFESYNDGNNVYTCHGTARAFSKRLYTSLHFLDSVGEDAYSYLYATANNFSYQYVPDAKVYYRSPGTFADHKKQSSRFLYSYELMKKTFGTKFVTTTYRIPLQLYPQPLISAIRQHPLHMSTYIVLFAYIATRSHFNKRVENTWEISQSSKVL